MKKLIAGLFVVITTCFYSQKIKLPQQSEFKWPDNNANFDKIPDSLKNEDAVILKDDISITETSVKRRVAVLILTEEAVQKFSTIQLPENFDLTNNPNFKKIGRFSDRKDPYIYSFKPQYFAARVLSSGKHFQDADVNMNVNKVVWVDYDGQRISDYISGFNIAGLTKGDVLEYTYGAEVNWGGRQDVIYPNSIYPKLNCDIKIVTALGSDLKNILMVYEYKIPEGFSKQSFEHKNGDKITTYNYSFKNLQSVHLPENARVGTELPNISVNHSIGAYRTGSALSNTANYVIFDKYKWVVTIDTSGKTKVYDNYHANIRKFISKIAVSEPDSNGTIFLARLMDSLNNLKFMSAEGMNYGETSQYAVTSSELLLKGKLPEEFIFKNYVDFLSEKNIMYFRGVVMDKRYSVVNPEYRNHFSLERRVVVIPDKKTYRFYMPRVKGLKYNPDELPFYYEGTKCVLLPCYDCAYTTQNTQILYLPTPKSTFNENVRSESGSFRVSTDSLKLSANIKENLSGQFSTILRHYYNNDYIDSTITSNYYKKCIDKPMAKSISLKKSSESKVFPFRTTYNCHLSLPLLNKSEINLNNWFSFFVTKNAFSKQPNHDYYIDFQYTDTYNYLFEFDKPVDVLNTEALTKKLSNEYFEIISFLNKQDASKYLFTVSIKCKKDVIPQNAKAMLTEFAAVLDELNNLKLNYKIL